MTSFACGSAAANDRVRVGPEAGGAGDVPAPRLLLLSATYADWKGEEQCVLATD